MTLTALRTMPDGTLTAINPSLIIEKDPEAEADVIEELRKIQSKEIFHCPHCYDETREFFPVRMRNPENKRVHFYHPKSDSDKGCANHSPESEKHKNAKLAIAHYLRANGYAETVWNEYDEDIKRITLPGLKRHPDLLALMPNGSLIVHEVQASPITPEELRQRTEDYRSCIQSRISQVVWYMGSKAYTRENRQILRSMTNVRCFRLFFKKSDANFPDWAEDDAPIERKKASKSEAIDYCPTPQLATAKRASSGGLTHISAIRAAPAAAKERFDPPRPVRISTPKVDGEMGQGFYHGMDLEAIGVDTDDLIAVQLPKTPDRPAYLGRFKAEYIEFIED